MATAATTTSGLESNGFHVYNTDTGTGLTGITVPLNLTNEPMVGHLTVCVTDRHDLNDIEDVLRMVPTAKPDGRYRIKVAGYVSNEDSRVAFDGIYSLELIPAMLGTFEDKELIMKWG